MAAAGDVLLSINDIDLTHLTYNEAVTILKTQAAQNTVTLRVIQTFAEEEEQDGESSTREDMETLEGPKEDDINWAPLWTRWLGLPRYNFFEILIIECKKFKFDVLFYNFWASIWPYGLKHEQNS